MFALKAPVNEVLPANGGVWTHHITHQQKDAEIVRVAKLLNALVNIFRI